MIKVPPGECVVLQIQSHVLTELTCYTFNQYINTREGHTLIRIDELYLYPLFNPDYLYNTQKDQIQKELSNSGDYVQLHFFHGKIIFQQKFWPLKSPKLTIEHQKERYVSVHVQPPTRPSKTEILSSETPHVSRSLSHQSIVLKNEKSKPGWLSSSYSWLETQWYHINCDNVPNEIYLLFKPVLIKIACKDHNRIPFTNPFNIKVPSTSFAKPNLYKMEFWLQDTNFETTFRIGKLKTVSDPREHFCQGIFSNTTEHVCMKYMTEHMIHGYHFESHKSYQFHVLFYENAEIIFHPNSTLHLPDLKFTWNEILSDVMKDMTENKIFTSTFLVSWLEAHKMCKKHGLVMPLFQSYHHLREAIHYVLHKLKIIPSALFLDIIMKVNRGST